MVPEKFRNRRENVEKRFRCSHCWASWGVLVGRRFCGMGEYGHSPQRGQSTERGFGIVITLTSRPKCTVGTQQRL